MHTSTTPRRGRLLAALVALGFVTVAVLTTGQLPTAAEDDHGAPQVTLLTGRSASPDAVASQLKLRLDGRGPTHVMNMKDVDHLLLAELTFAPGDLVDWHTHPGPVIVVVEQGVLTVTSSDCTSRDYGPQEVYVEQGRGDVLKVENEGGDDTVIYALFFEVPEDGPLTIPEDDPGC